MTVKKILAAAMAVTLMFGAAGSILPLKSVDATISASAMTPEEEERFYNGEVTLDESTGVLTLYGCVRRYQIEEYKENTKVKSIVADNLVLDKYCSHMFYGGSRLKGDVSEYWSNVKTIDLSDARATDVEDMSYMFYNLTGVKTIKMSGLVTPNLRRTNHMFEGCLSLQSLDLKGLDAAGIEYMEHMFDRCVSLESLDLSEFETYSATNMEGMFFECVSLKNLDLSYFFTNEVTDMSYMFYGCRRLSTLDLSKFDTSNVQDMGDMFADCGSLQTIYVSSKWNTKNVSDSGNMFERCSSLVGGNGTEWQDDITDKKYARIDTKKTPGYLSTKEKQQEEPVKTAKGDVNADGKIDIEDAVMVINHVNGQKALSSDETKRANVDGNSKVDIEDAVAIIAHVNGIKSLT